MPERCYPLWSAGAEPALLASRALACGEIVFPALAPASPLHAEPRTGIDHHVEDVDQEFGDQHADDDEEEDSL